MRHLIELDGFTREDADRLGRRVWALVRRNYSGVPPYVAEPEDLFQIAALAIVKGHRRFDRTRGASADTWAFIKATRGIQDALRQLTHNRAGREDHGLKFVPLDTPLPGDGGLTVADVLSDGFEFEDPFAADNLASALARLP